MTYQKRRPRRGQFASALRPLPPACASVLRPLCFYSGSAGTCSCVRPAGALRPVCVGGGVDAVIRFLFVDRRKISRFAFNLRKVVGIRFHACEFNHLTYVSVASFASGSNWKLFFINLAMVKLSQYARNRVISLSTANISIVNMCSNDIYMIQLMCSNNVSEYVCEYFWWHM